ncbi:MAG TPA: uroporphyrinogen decarboxylase [Actinomycetota bacterium]|nr:uroporphyrinogen decarboxylase [Actinomycetota bacterium]
MSVAVRPPRAATAPKPAFLAAARGEPAERRPVWFMRQAGRSLPEYRAVRARHSMQEICRTPELAAEVTLQPVRRLGVDAAILFGDIMVPLEGAGISVRFEDGRGPVIDDPIRGPRDVTRLRPLEPDEDVPHVIRTVELLADELDVPLIGFAGAPFTLASYLVEGGPSKAQARTRALMLADPATWASLMQRLADSTVAYLAAQVRAGAEAVQLFDSWAGSLSEADYRRHVLPWVTRVMRGIAGLGVPRVYFALGSSHLLPALREVEAEVLGIDWRTPFPLARATLGAERVLQGNLDPVALLAGWREAEARTIDVLRGAGDRHVFNLGHGVLPETDPGVLRRVVETVHGWTP